MDAQFSLDILIPTYNRSEFLLKNLTALTGEAKRAGLEDVVRIIVSDNCSTDDTVAAVTKMAASSAVPIRLLTSDRNYGLEQNAVKVLKESDALHVMFLGDDDFLPQGYLAFVIGELQKKGPRCFIPGFSGLYGDGRLVPMRGGKPVSMPAGFGAALALSHYGHQLSGLTMPRAGLLDAYLTRQEYRNIYLFIFLLGFSITRYPVSYVPSFQVMVSQSNSKDWNYDASGLLTEIFPNYQALYPNASLKCVLCCLRFTFVQRWRLRPTRASTFYQAMKHVLNSDRVAVQVKVGMLAALPVLIIRALLGPVGRRLRALFARHTPA